jgi:DNA-binding transcriptional regulator YhcF (GntR family)
LSNDEIIRYFNIDHDSDVTLVAQLKACFAEFIRQSAVGTRIPPERKIAEVLKLSRVTVRNAMQDFFDAGQVSRNGRRGTFVAGKKAVNILADIHPMALGIVRPVAVTTLKLLLHENIPYQKEFWECAIGEFNRSHQSRQIEIVWLPHHIHEYNMDEYLRDNKFDIIQVQVKESMQGLGCRVPDKLQQQLKSDKFYLDLYTGDTATLVESIVPIHQTRSLTFWNGDLAEQIGLKKVRSRLRAGKMLEVFADAADRLPDDMLASGHIWDIPALRGIPHDLTFEQLDKYLLDEFATFMPYAGRENMFMTRQKYSLDMVENFVAGNQLFINTLPTHLFLYGKQTDFKLKVEPFPVASGNIAGGGAMGLCVAKNSVNSADSFTFIEFMLSNNIQRMLAEMKWVIPFRRTALNYFSTTLGVEAEVITDAVNIMRIDVNSESLLTQYINIIGFQLRDELHELMHGKCDAIACAAAFMSIWKQLKVAI